jgi:predicted transcriptional regulator
MVHPLKAALVQAGVSQARAGKALGIAPDALNNYLNGRRAMPQQVERRMWEFLDYVKKLPPFTPAA